MDAPLLQFEMVTKAKAGLDGIDFAVARGETFALLGAPGAGKTTVLRLLAGLERPDAGRVLLDGRDLAPQSPPRRGLAYLRSAAARAQQCSGSGRPASRQFRHPGT